MTVTIRAPSEGAPLVSPSIASSIIIVDCGSGYSRVANFHQLQLVGGGDNKEGDESTTQHIRAITTKSNIAALHTVIHCPAKSSEWLRQLVDIVKHVHTCDDHQDSTTSTTPQVLIGATGGVRDLISSGEITTREIDVFRALLSTSNTNNVADLLPFQATLRILSGEEEAKYEFLSVQYCAQQCGYTTNEGTTLGLLSSGGMSSQIFVEQQGGAHCLETKIKKGNKLGLDHGMSKGIALFSRHVEEAIAEAKIPEQFGGEGVLYIAIEMLAAAGEKAGIGGIVMPVADAVEALSTFIEKETENDEKLGHECERTWRTYVYVMSGIVGKFILAKLHPNSTVLFLREFKLGEDHLLKPSWPLGYAVDSLREER